MNSLRSQFGFRTLPFVPLLRYFKLQEFHGVALLLSISVHFIFEKL